METINLNDMNDVTTLRKLKQNENYRRFYANNRERLIKEKNEYRKTHEEAKKHNLITNRMKYYVKKGLFTDITNRDIAWLITAYIVNNDLSIKKLPYIKHEYLNGTISI